MATYNSMPLTRSFAFSPSGISDLNRSAPLFSLRHTPSWNIGEQELIDGGSEIVTIQSVNGEGVTSDGSTISVVPILFHIGERIQ